MENIVRIYEIAPGQKQQVMPGYSDEDVFNVLKKNCSEAWAAMVQAKKMLFRGSYDNRPIIHAKTRIDRTTATLDEPRQQIEAAFQQAGFKALRINSISCISSFGDAGNFGDEVYIIIPKNGFSFTWSPHVDDFGTMTGGDVMADKIPKLMKQYSCDSVYELMIDVFKYTDKNFPAAIASGNEVSIGGEYYALNADMYYTKIKSDITQ